jgi:hypothetical protein
LLLPPVGLFADVEDLCGDDMPAFGPSAIEKIAVVELCFGSEMVLSQRLGIGDERVGLDALASFAIEGRLGRLGDIAIEGCYRADGRRLPRPATLWRPRVADRLRQVLAALKRNQEVKRLDLISVFGAAVELLEPAQQLGGCRAIAADRRLTEARVIREGDLIGMAV